MGTSLESARLSTITATFNPMDDSRKWRMLWELSLGIMSMKTIAMKKKVANRTLYRVLEGIQLCLREFIIFAEVVSDRAVHVLPKRRWCFTLQQQDRTKYINLHWKHRSGSSWQVPCIKVSGYSYVVTGVGSWFFIHSHTTAHKVKAWIHL